MFSKSKGLLKSKITYINVSDILPNSYQPRKYFDRDELNCLCESIKENGILQPLSIRKIDGGKYELVAGERRLRASMMAGLVKVPCIEVLADEDQIAVLSLVENLQRENLTFFEEAFAISRLIEEWGITQEQAAEKLGKAQSTIANKIRLLRLSPELQEIITKNNLSERHARAILRLPDDKQRKSVINKVISKRLTVTETDDLITLMLYDFPPKMPDDLKSDNKRYVYKDVRIFVNTINKAIEAMQHSGIEAKTEKNESDNFIEYKICIPKSITP